jgi:primosomal protein N' (replication factor Y) (superfamily II helicase)
MSVVFKICIPHTLRDYFNYHHDGALTAGSRVIVPFRNKQRIGIVLGQTSFNPNIKTKAIESIINDAPLLPEALLTLCKWVSTYYQSPLSEVLPLVIPKKYREGGSTTLPRGESYALSVDAIKAHMQINKQAKKQHELIDFLSQQDKALSKKDIVSAGYSSTQLSALEKKELLTKQETLFLPYTSTLPLTKPLKLNSAQQEAVNAISNQLHTFQCFLLQGVTGSGKTEVYLQVINKVLLSGQQVLILVPEIGLTPQLLDRFRKRFSAPMVVIHSHLNDSERQQAWQFAHDGIAKLVIGTRTAVFTPMPHLGLIIIDEEHDTSLKQMEGVRYSARDTALVRAQALNVPIILGSATPSLESLNNCLNQKYTKLVLPNRAISKSKLHFNIMDIRNKQLVNGLTSETLSIIKQHLSQGNQVLVFINRRGFSPVLLCHQCGWMADCKACDSHLTYHQSINKLICHHCGLSQFVPTTCKTCQSHSMIPIGAGTQRIYDYLATECSDYAVVRIDRDAVSKKNALESSLEKISTGASQLIVGTQMLAKGHHFPKLTLVVILDADNGFYNQDFRAIEKLGQLITQVAGRAGREDKPGEIVIQTHLPHHPLLNTLIQEGYESFAEILLPQRAQADLPPYYFMAVIRAQSKTQSKVLQFLHQAKTILKDDHIHVLGPAPAPLARKADYYRLQLLIKSASRKKLHATLTKLRSSPTINTISRGIRWNIDVDPMDLS